MKTRSFSLLPALLLASCASSSIHIGAIADCQYADADDSGERLYRASPDKLRACVDQLNQADLEFVVHLGDLIDRDLASYDIVLPILEELDARPYIVLGNHEFSVPDEHKRSVPGILGLERRYYDFTRGDWRFVVVDGNELSLYAWPADSPEHAASQAYADAREGEEKPWNGAAGSAQLQWIDEVLTAADAAGENVMLFCHFPIYPAEALWNAAEMRTLLGRHPSVKAWLNGHHHDGDYGEWEGIHFLTLKGMVDTSESAYAVLELTADEIRVDGFGREPDRVLRLR